GGGQRRQVLPELGVVVQRHLAVEGDHTAVLGEDERVDLDEGRVLADEDVPQLGDHLDGALGGGLGELALGDDVGGDVGGGALEGVDGDLRNSLGVGRRDLFDLHAALGGADGEEGAV